MTGQVSNARTLVSIKKTGDLETHLRYVEVDGVRVVELRDFIVSLGEYGRGYWVPAESALLGELAKALFQLAVEEGVS